jgi:cation:H+ antiporter
LTYLLFCLGLAALFFGGEYLVKGASGVARHFRLSPMVIGLTVVGFGTSAPELLVSLEAALDGKPAIAIGNVVGSNIANILLILGISALIAPLIIPVSKLSASCLRPRQSCGACCLTVAYRGWRGFCFSPVWVFS